MTRDHSARLPTREAPEAGQPTSRAARRRGDKPEQPVPTSRRGSWGFAGFLHMMPEFVKGSAPNDMRPREVDRKAIKNKRKTATKARRKK